MDKVYKNKNMIRHNFKQRKLIHFCNEMEASNFVKLYGDIFEISTILTNDGRSVLLAKVSHSDWLECVRCLKLKKFKPYKEAIHYEWRFEGSC